jgi:hypothetical protein
LIQAGIAGLWAGVTSAEWATTTNWDNWLVPVSASPASIISGGSPPVLNTFYNLAVSKPNVSLIILPDITVNGNVTINP